MSRGDIGTSRYFASPSLVDRSIKNFATRHLALLLISRPCSCVRLSLLDVAVNKKFATRTSRDAMDSNMPRLTKNTSVSVAASTESDWSDRTTQRHLPVYKRRRCCECHF